MALPLGRGDCWLRNPASAAPSGVFDVIVSLDPKPVVGERRRIATISGLVRAPQLLEAVLEAPDQR